MIIVKVMMQIKRSGTSGMIRGTNGVLLTPGSDILRRLSSAVVSVICTTAFAFSFIRLRISGSRSIKGRALLLLIIFEKKLFSEKNNLKTAA